MRFGFGLAAALAAAALSGCGGGGVSGLVSVSGTVTLNGSKPLEGAEITFIPVQGNPSGLPANDITGPDGNYKVMTQGRSGMVPGKYRVVISKSMVDMSKVHPDLQDDPYMVALGQGIEPTAANANANPSMLTGEFERDIPAEGGVQDFDVKSKATP